MRFLIFKRFAVAVIFFCGLPLCFVDAKEIAYDQVYPYYVEVSAVSRFWPLGKPEGGGWGHVLMYIKGVCLNATAPYPKIRMCEDNEGDIHDPETGMGVSVDKMFKNVNWMAVPGKQLFYHGNLASDDRVTRERFEAAAREAVKLGLVRGIEFYEEYLTTKPAKQNLEEFIAQQTLGTDYAVKFARSTLIARIPVTKDQVSKMVDYLNIRNEEVFSRKTVFKWSAYYDNCAHTTHNALAAAGIWKAKPINQYKVKQFFHLAMPANEFANLAFLGEDRPGGLLETIRAQEPNDLFRTEYKLYVAEGLRKAKTRKVRKMLADPRHTDIEANLLYHKKRKEAILEKKPGILDKLVPGRIAKRLEAEKELEDLTQKLRILNTNA